MERKAHRLPSSAISSLRQDGKVLFFFFGKSILKSNDVNNFRFNSIVSKKVAGTAVERNRIKRQIFHALQEVQAAERLKGVDMMFITHPRIHTVEYRQLKEALDRLITKYNS